MFPTEDADPAYAAPPVLTVTALNQQVARLLERTFPLIWIGGEISNFTRAASGHWYFTLKDDAAQVRAVMFRGRAQYAGFTPREGDKVEVRALVTLYGARGDYQINVEAIRRAGVGALYEAFMRLKEKLGAEGLFDEARKRPLPLFARTVGIVTSPQAAALRDVLTALRRRVPYVRIVLYPAPVQGQLAAQKIAEAIATASHRREVDVLLVCRGGGSIEDLWSFNEEAVARAIAACSMPVISGVGHETDFTIADFAADLRAATPTAAAELAATARADWLASLEADAGDLRRAMDRILSDASQGLDNLSRRLLSPSSQIAHQRLKLLGMASTLTHAVRAPLNRHGVLLGPPSPGLERTAHAAGIRPAPPHGKRRQPVARAPRSAARAGRATRTAEPATYAGARLCDREQCERQGPARAGADQGARRAAHPPGRRQRRSQRGGRAGFT
jgi:exodeoxyribonuclease VII large subunit